MSSPALHISTLNGQRVTRWQGTEMAFSEGNIRWEDLNIPFLQLVQLDLQLSNGQALRVVSQLEDGTGFHGLYVVELKLLPELNLEAEPSSIYRDREMPELPTGIVVVAHTRHQGPNATLEANLNIDGAELRLLAAEVYEEGDGSLVIVEPDESVLVQVNGARPLKKLHPSD